MTEVRSRRHHHAAQVCAHSDQRSGGHCGCGILGRHRAGKRCSASALAAHTPESTNGERCSTPAAARPATPFPARRIARSSAAGSALKSPFGTFYAPNISPDPTDGIGRWSEARIRDRAVEGHVAGRPALFSGVSLHVLSAHASWTTCAICSPTSRRCRRCKAASAITMCRFPSTCAARSAAGSSSTSTASRSSPIRQQSAAMEPRRLSRQRAVALRGVPQPARCAWRHHRAPAICRRPEPGRRRLDSQYHAEGFGRLFGEGHRLYAQDRQTPGGDSVGGAMVAVVRNTSQLSDEDRNAMAVYIKSLPPVEGPPQPAKK